MDAGNQRRDIPLPKESSCFAIIHTIAQALGRKNSVQALSVHAENVQQGKVESYLESVQYCY